VRAGVYGRWGGRRKEEGEREKEGREGKVERMEGQIEGWRNRQREGRVDRWG
jgi:hypothetical protein